MKKLCILLPNLSHAGLSPRGNIPAICENHGYHVALYEWSKEGFDEQKILDEIHNVAQQDVYNSIIIISNSFGDIIARKLLTDTTLTIDAHISVCGVGNISELSWLTASILFLGTHFWKYIYPHPSCTRLLARILNRGKTPHEKKLAEAVLTKSAMLGMNAGLKDRAIYMKKHPLISGNIGCPGYILYSGDDNSYRDPKHNAYAIAAHYQHAKVISLGNAGHGSFIEMPDKYDPIIENIVSSL